MAPQPPRTGDKKQQERSLHLLAEVLRTKRQKKFLIIGDVMLDVFVRSRVDRISPEAPVPVVLQESQSVHLGGAGNTASNIAGFGADTTLIGIVGNDIEGRELSRIAKKQGVMPRFVVDHSRPTTTKTRVVARDHHIVRIDKEARDAIAPAIEKQLLALLEKMPMPDWVIISDYAKGLITKSIMERVKKRFGGQRILVDPKPVNAHLFKNVRVLKINATEAFALCGISISSDQRAARAAKILAERFKASIVITRGEFGMTAFDRETERPLHIRTLVSMVRDVTGAGDTAAAALSFMLSHNAPLYDSVRIANHAASIAVSRDGTSTISAEDILRSTE